MSALPNVGIFLCLRKEKGKSRSLENLEMYSVDHITYASSEGDEQHEAGKRN